MSEATETKPGDTKPGVTLVTADNFEQYANEQLGVAEPLLEDAAAAELVELEAQKAANLKAESEANVSKAEEEQEKEPKEGDEDGGKVYFNRKWTPKSDFSYRMHLKTEEANAAKEQARKEREARAKVEQEAAELRAKYEPPKSDELDPEPLPAQFSDVSEYAKALKDWTAEKTRYDDRKVAETQRQEQERARIAKDWETRQKAAREKIQDYDEKLTNSSVKVSDDMRDAILESEVGPEILIHLADNPDVAEKLGKMTVRKMLVEFGKLESSMGGADKPQLKSEKTTVAEISRAPAPITPLRSNGTPVATVKTGADEWHGTFEEYQKAKRAGKIRMN